jgi:hypothetical protein
MFVDWVSAVRVGVRMRSSLNSEREGLVGPGDKEEEGASPQRFLQDSGFSQRVSAKS